MSPKIHQLSEPVSAIGLSLNDTCLKEGSNVSVRCEVKGFPRSSVEFQLNSIPIIPGRGAFQNFVLEFYDQVLCMHTNRYPHTQ